MLSYSYTTFGLFHVHGHGHSDDDVIISKVLSGSFNITFESIETLLHFFGQFSIFNCLESLLKERLYFVYKFCCGGDNVKPICLFLEF